MRFFGIVGAALALSTVASAQEMSREDIRRSLDEQVIGEQQARPGARVSRTRGFGAAPAPAAAAPRPLAFRQIRFAFGSADLSPISTPTLEALADALAGAMLDPNFRGVTFLVIGYTDAKGSDDANLLLSQRRADAVVRDLVTRGIVAGRLVAVGRGERDLADPEDPEGAINRRVEVRAKL